MAAWIGWLAANWLGVVLALVAGVLAVVNKWPQKVAARLRGGPDRAATAGESSLDTLLRTLAEKLQPLFERLGMRGDAAKRTMHQFFLICIEDDVANLPDGPEKAEQLAAIQTLAKYRVSSVPKST